MRLLHVWSRHFLNCCFCVGSWSKWVETFKSRSISYSPVILLDASPIGFQSQIFWELISQVQVPSIDMPNVGHNPLTPQGETPYLWDSWLWVTVLEVEFLKRLHFFILFHTCLSVDLLSFFCGRSYTASFQVFFRGNYFIKATDLLCLWGGGEFRIFLCHHINCHL